MKKQEITLMTDYTDLYDEAKRRYEKLIKIRKSKEEALEKMPPGKIHISKTTKGVVEYYLRQDSKERTGKYIPKSEITTIRQYLQKAYDEMVLKFVTKDIQSLRKLLEKSIDAVGKIRQVYSKLPPEAKKFVKPIDVSDDDYASNWSNMPFEGKAIPEYVPFLETKRKERVRSKSELNIANALANHEIPYKYECPLQLNNGMIIYPDFTVLDVKRRRELYWEHRGMMDDKDYARNSVLKMKGYLQNGIYLGDKLIITEETSTAPLGTNEINAVIKRYLI